MTKFRLSYTRKIDPLAHKALIIVYTV
jgi:hypothetical protein